MQRLSASQQPLLFEPTSSSLSLHGSESKVPMVEQRFYPQFHQEELSGPKVALSVFYSVSSQTLYVKIICGQNFPPGVPHCVKVKLYPGRSAKQRTRECEGITPEFYEEFNFHVRKNVLHTKVLKLRVVGIGTSAKGEEEKRLLGCVNIPMTDLRGLDQLDILEDYRSGTMWKKLEQGAGLSEGVKLCASLKWSPEPCPGLLTLKILQASGLHETSDSDYSKAPSIHSTTCLLVTFYMKVLPGFYKLLCGTLLLGVCVRRTDLTTLSYTNSNSNQNPALPLLYTTTTKTLRKSIFRTFIDLIKESLSLHVSRSSEARFECGEGNWLNYTI